MNAKPLLIFTAGLLLAAALAAFSQDTPKKRASQKPITAQARVPLSGVGNFED